MKSISSIAFLIFSLFVFTSESKKFCKEFEENGNGIDYTFDFSYFYESQSYTNIVFIIGYDYWLIDVKDLDFLKFESIDSAFSDVFGDQYSTVFSVYRSNPQSYEYGFLKNSSIEWKALNHSLDFNTTQNVILKTTNISLPQKIQSIHNERQLSFRLRYWNSGELRAFVGQKQNTKSEITPFEKTYVSFNFKNGSEGEAQQITNQRLVNHSESESHVIGVIGAVKYNNKIPTTLVFFQRNQIIEYCFQNITQLLNYSLDRPCLNERIVLIDCSKESMKTPWLLLIVIAVVVGVCILIAICGCCVFRNRKLFFGRETSEEDTKGSQSKSSKKNTEKTTQSLVGNQDGLTVITVDTETGLPTDQTVKLITQAPLSEKSQKSEQNSQKKSKSSAPKKTTKKVLPKN